MRISTSTIYATAVDSMQTQTGRMLQTQQQISTGRRILTPADDPVAAAQALGVSQSQSINAQYGTNNGSASDSISLEESTLGSLTTLLQNVRAITVQAGDAALSQSDRASLAQALRGSYQDLLGLANTTDTSGQYLFSGYQGGIRPFSETAPGAVLYNGDQGQRLIQVGPSRQIAVSDSGADVFQRIPNGNGSFAAQAAATNSGSGVIDAGSVTDPAKWNAAGKVDLTVKFSVSGGATTYDIIDNASGKSLLTGNAPGAAPYPRSYASGSNIDLSQVGPPAFDYGAQVSVSGAPADGDSFTVKSSTSQDVFATVSGLADLLQSSSSGAALTNGLAAAQQNIDNALQNITGMRASAGSRLKELDTLKSVGDDRALQYTQTLSRLQDVDYAAAASDLAQEQLNLQAAQKSFAQVSGLSLFNYLS